MNKTYGSKTVHKQLRKEQKGGSSVRRSTFQGSGHHFTIRVICESTIHMCGRAAKTRRVATATKTMSVGANGD